MTHVRKICSYIKNSTRCKERLQARQSELVAPINVKLDVRSQSCKDD
jgi:hypothetical protein